MRLQLRAQVEQPSKKIGLYCLSDEDRSDRQVAKEVANLFKPFGIYTYTHPGFRGSDMFAYLLSPRRLTKQEVDSTRSMHNDLPEGSTIVAFDWGMSDALDALEKACAFFNLQTLTEGPMDEIVSLAASNEAITSEDVAKAFYGRDYQNQLNEGMNPDGSYNE